MPAVTRVLAGFKRDQLASFVEVAIGLLDLGEPDPDLEANGDDEPLEANGDSEDAAWVEWDQMRGSQKGGANLTLGEEDAEDDDPEDGTCCEDQPAFDERSRRIANLWGDSGAGCEIGDPGGCEHDGREADDDGY